MSYSHAVLLFGGPRTPVEDEEHRLIFFSISLFFDITLMLAKKLWMQLHISRLVHPVNISKPGCDGEIGADCAEGLVDVVDILGLGVKGVIVDFLVIDTVFFATGDPNLLHMIHSVVVWVISLAIRLPSPAIVSWAPLS